VPPDSVRCTRGKRLQTLHLWVSEASLRYNSPDCLVCQRSNGWAAQRSTPTVACKREQFADSSRRVKAAPEGAPDSEQYLSGAPLDSVQCTRGKRLQTLHLRVSEAALRYNSPECPVCQWSNGWEAQRSTHTVAYKREQCADSSRRVRAAPKGALDNEQYLSDAPRSQSSSGRNRQNSNSWVTWLAHRAVFGGAPNCPVRPSTDSLPNG
jgi:hypothetical protein